MLVCQLLDGIDLPFSSLLRRHHLLGADFCQVNLVLLRQLLRLLIVSFLVNHLTIQLALELLSGVRIGFVFLPYRVIADRVVQVFLALLGIK